MIRKNSGGTILDSSRIFILGIDSKVIAEYIYVSGAWKVDHYNLYANDMVGKFVPTTGNNGNRYYYEKDHLGSVRVVVNESKNIESWTDFYPYGKISREGNSLNEPKDGFTGYIHDDESNLEYAGARYYNSTLGRYLSCDPLGSAFPSWTLYNYVYNNPINLFDPTGLAADSPGTFVKDPYTDDDINSNKPRDPTNSGALFVPEQDDNTDSENGNDGNQNNNQSSDIKDRIKLTAPTAEQLEEAFSWYAGGVTKATKLGAKGLKLWPLIKAFFTGAETYGFKRHAIYQMAERGINIDQVAKALRTGERFSYFHEGVWKVGFYDAETKIFLGTMNNDVMTVFKTGSKFIQNLKDIKP